MANGPDGIERPLIFSVPVPEFVRVTVCAALVVPTNWSPNASVFVLRVAPELPWPTPDSDTLIGPNTAFDVICRLPVRDPAAVGANFTSIVQVPPDATVVQVFALTLKSPAGVATMLPTVPFCAVRVT